MSLNQYQTLAGRFAAYYGQIEYPFFGLSEEVGEVSGKLAKYMRKHNKTAAQALNDAWSGVEPLHTDLKTELGDVLWMVQQCATELGLTLNEIAGHNLNKLGSRADRGVLVGEGDDR